MLRIGLTGGLAAGKSLVAESFRAAGIPVLDADCIGRELLDTDERLRAAVQSAFGLSDAPEKLDRRELARRAFSAPGAQKRLNALLHPAIRAEVNARLRAMEKKGVERAAVEAALLLEAGLAGDFDAMVLVEAENHDQLERFQARTGLSREEAAARLRLQWTNEVKRLRVQESGRPFFIIANRGSRQELSLQAESCVSWLKSL